MAEETVLITGASSGIGRELAKLFAADGAALVAVARSETKLRALADELKQQHGIQTRVLARDLSDPAAPDEIFRTLSEEEVHVDVLVNNAGFGDRGPVAELALERQLDMVQVNVTAVTHLSRLFLPGMLSRRKGGILNLASTAAFQPGPNMAVYYATKAYVLSFSEALTEEVRGTGVHVCCLAPGATETGFAEEANMQSSPLFRLGTMDVLTVARAGYEGLREGHSLVVPGLRNRAGVFAVRLLPRALVRKAAGALQS